MSATANWAEENAQLKVWSVTPEGKKILDHATCTVKFFDTSVAEAEWKRSAYLIKRSIQHLQESTETGDAHRMKRGMVYKLFSALVEYDENYKSIQEVILDSENHEATALVKFQAPPGNFHRNPFWIDSIGHLSGFIMNASDGTDSKNQVFVNHGWDSMRCLKKFDPSVTYRTYVRMQLWKDSIYAGDVYLFDGDNIVGVFGGVKVRGRKMIKYLTSDTNPNHSSKHWPGRSSMLLFHPQEQLSLLLRLSLLLSMSRKLRHPGPRRLIVLSLPSQALPVFLDALWQSLLRRLVFQLQT